VVVSTAGVFTEDKRDLRTQGRPAEWCDCLPYHAVFRRVKRRRDGETKCRGKRLNAGEEIIIISETGMKPTFEKRTCRKPEPCNPKGHEFQRQVALGRMFMKKYADTFRALAK
jgi:hypothetical protein